MTETRFSDSYLPAFSSLQPDQIEPDIRKVLGENRARVDQLIAEANEGGDFETSILPLEELAERLHRVWSPISHLHGVANTPELREAYNACLPELARYETELAQDERICALYQAAMKKIPADEQQDARRMLELGLRDFRLAGVDLPQERKQRYKEIAEELSATQAKFEQNILDAMAAWSHYESDAGALAGLPSATLEQAAARAKQANKSGWLFTLDQPTYVAVMTHAENRDLRRLFYRAWATRASDQEPSPADFDNTQAIETILRLRHEAAQLVGFDNFAEYSLASKMASSVDEVSGFLEELAKRSYRAAKDELASLERFAGRALAAWDVGFYAEKLREERYAVSDAELRPYFPLDRVLTGLFALIRRLYGVNIAPVENVDVWQPEVRFYAVRGANGELLGGLYTDLFARPDKRSGAWMDECVNRMHFGEHDQVGIAHLVCNFSPPTASAPSLLNHDDVLTLFHEIGHCLHHVLSRVPYPSVAGINGVPWDAVELPSQFMENFAWEPEVVKMISGHHRTGEQLPDKLLDKLRASRVFHTGMQMVRQLEFAIFDLELHAEYDPRLGSQLGTILEQVRKRVAVVRHPEYNRFAHAFSHIFGGGYAAGYYSYKWAEVLAADAWSAFVEQGVLDAQTAQRFRHGILEVGGTVDIGEAFAEFRGRPPRIEPLLEQAGILSAADAG